MEMHLARSRLEKTPQLNIFDLFERSIAKRKIRWRENLDLNKN